MKKILTLLFMLVLTLLLFAGCGESSGSGFLEDITVTTADTNGAILDGVYEIVEGSGFRYYHDPITDCMYLWRKSAYAGGLTQMLDPDTGMPLTYERFIAYYDSCVNNP